MPQSTEAQGIFRDPIIQANVEMLKLAMKNLALAGIMINISSDDGWHKGELMHVGEQLINGKCNDITNTDLTEADAAELEIEIYARETVEVAPPDYIVEDINPLFSRLAPCMEELVRFGVLQHPGDAIMQQMARPV
jgi:hypothetical protein